jgi:hypothetical protein
MNRVHVVFSAMVLLASASAQDTGSFLPEAAFLSSLKGDVSVVSGANTRVTTGVVNARLVGGDRVVTESFSRADIRFPSGDVVRAGANAELLLSQLENGHYQMQLARGTLDYGVPRPSTANIEIHTPSVSIRPSQVGVYRMTVKGNGESEISARAGRLEIYGPGGAEWLDPGQKMVARGPASNPEFRILGGPSRWKRLLGGLRGLAQIASLSASAGGSGDPGGGGGQAEASAAKSSGRAQPSSTAAKASEGHARAAESNAAKSSGGSVHESARTADHSSSGGGGGKSPDPPARSK